MDQVIKKCKKILREHYGRKFQGLLLYGSMARNQAGHDSDIDILVLLNKPFNHFRELRQITELLYPLQLEAEQHISAKPAAVDEFENGLTQLYRNARFEGVLV